MKITPLSSSESHTSFEPVTPSKAPSTLTNTQSAKFYQRIENEYVALQKSEAVHCYYLKKNSIRACDQLRQSPDGMFKVRNDRKVYKISFIYLGTYFVRPAEETERISNIEYFLVFVCHKEVTQAPICCDTDRRTFWFLCGTKLIYENGRSVFVRLDFLLVSLYRIWAWI